MANKCITQLILSGDRIRILDLISSSELYYANNKIHEMNDNTFCVVLVSEWTPPYKYFVALSKQYPTIEFDLFYATKLSSVKGHYSIKDGLFMEAIENDAFTLSEMSNQLSSNNFYTSKELTSCGP